ncbi:MAG: phosphoribosylglycinamide formyltransferase [Firmicutes bacterium]|jgi:phosphoribosylglycinamide formyltransferase-1|nr:phosphoribosylglycinamide formyltransferase [Bacillota bacterium]
MKRLAVLASGRGSNLQAIIDAVRAGELALEIVGAASDQPGAQALARAAVAGIPTAAFPRAQYGSRAEQEAALLAWLTSLRVDIVALAGYMRILSARFIQELGCPILNIHPSLLPAFPGLNAQRQALDYGVRVSGCTVHFVDEGVDSGPIILQEAVPVFPDDTVESLSERILKVEHRVYPQALKMVAEGLVRPERRCGRG